MPSNLNVNLSGTTWRFLDKERLLQINKVPNYFPAELVKREGDFSAGIITFNTIRKVDNIFGPECSVKISWEHIDPEKYHHGLKVKETIRMFSSINVVVTQKNTKWILSHELTYWIGTKQRFERGRYYPVNIVHSVHYCDLTQRVFEIHAEVISNYYQNYYNYIMSFIDSLQCHGV